MKTETIFLKAAVGRAVEIVPAARTINDWKRGKCWSAMCNNPIWFVHLGKTGKADIGYCYCCLHWRMYEYFAKGIDERGDWFLLEKGKLVKWVFDDKNKRPTYAKEVK